MVWVSAAKKTTAAAAYGSKKYKKYHKKRGSAYRKKQAFYVDHGYSYDPPSVVNQDNTIMILVAGVVGYFLVKKAGETAADSVKDVVDDVYIAAIDRFKTATSTENVQAAGFNFMGNLIDYQKWMMSKVLDVEKGAASAVVTEVSNVYADLLDKSNQLQARAEAQQTAYTNQLIGLLDKYADMNIMERNTAANAANIAAGNATAVSSRSNKGASVVPDVSDSLHSKAVESVYNPVVDHYISLRGGLGGASKPSTSSSSSSRYSSGGTYLGKKASWMK